LRDGSRRITAITEIVEVLDGVVKTQDLFRSRAFSGSGRRPSGHVAGDWATKRFLPRLAEAGVAYQARGHRFMTDYMPLVMAGLVFVATGYIILSISGQFSVERSMRHRAKILSSYARVWWCGRNP
jgi:glycine/D-amino acid oxidase-like deaminating enzyme